MQGDADRDADGPCQGVHDDLFVRAAYLEHADEAALIVGLDLLFLDRETVDACKAAIGDRLGLEARRVLLNASHTHSGPRVSRWNYAGPVAERLEAVETAAAEAAEAARASSRAAALWAGETRSQLPLSRRGVDVNGAIVFAPNPDAPVCDALPICLVKDMNDDPVVLLFSVSCHPSTVHGFDISADYPGVAMERLDEPLGAPASLFLQGTGGDAKPSVIGRGGAWHPGDWHDVRRAGLLVAREVMQALSMGLAPVPPRLRCALVETEWPLVPPPDATEYRALLESAATQGDDPETASRRAWAREQLARIETDGRLPSSVGLRLHGVQLANRVRLIGVEAEVVGELGRLIRDAYREGVTFALGCTNGARMYLPTSAMLYEGGYEVTSYFEYHQPAPLGKGIEHVLRRGLEELRRAGIGGP